MCTASLQAAASARIDGVSVSRSRVASNGTASASGVASAGSVQSDGAIRAGFCSSSSPDADVMGCSDDSSTGSSNCTSTGSAVACSDAGSWSFVIAAEDQNAMRAEPGARVWR